MELEKAAETQLYIYFIGFSGQFQPAGERERKQIIYDNVVSS